MPKANILIVEDEVKLATVLQDYLHAADYDCLLVHDGADALDAITQYKPSLIILDLNLPSLDGNAICTQARKLNHSMPILITTARIAEVDRITGLEIGADDYLCKPYSPKEVVARVNALLRRQQVYAQAVETQADDKSQRPLLNETLLSFDYAKQSVPLTRVEFYLLKPMLENPKRVYSRNQLMDSMYADFHVVNDRTIDSHIKKIRTKLAKTWQNTQFIHSVYGAGYMFEAVANL